MPSSWMIIMVTIFKNIHLRDANGNYDNTMGCHEPQVFSFSLFLSIPLMILQTSYAYRIGRGTATRRTEMTQHPGYVTNTSTTHHNASHHRRESPSSMGSFSNTMFYFYFGEAPRDWHANVIRRQLRGFIRIPKPCIELINTFVSTMHNRRG